MTNRNDATIRPTAPSAATPVVVHPSPTRVAASVRGPLDFGVTATGGTSADCFAAIMGQLAAMRDAGIIGDGACDAGVTGACSAEGTVAA